MCVIVTKPIGVDLPFEEYLENCFENNEDGAGFSYNENGKVITKKGYMTYESFITDLRKVENPKDKGMIMHFRIATHGGVSASNTHPFPITNDFKFMGGLYTRSSMVMAHNGIISSVYVPATMKVSDTMVFIKNYVSIMKEINPKFHLDERSQRLLATLSNSKLSFLDGEGNIVNIGQFEVLDGCSYSNSSYYSYAKTYYGTHDYDFPVTQRTKVVRTFMRPLDHLQVLNGPNGTTVVNDRDEFYMDVSQNIYSVDFLDSTAVLCPTLKAPNVKYFDLELKWGEYFEIVSADKNGDGNNDSCNVSKKQENALTSSQVANIVKLANGKELDPKQIAYYKEMFIEEDIQTVCSSFTFAELTTIITDYYGLSKEQPTMTFDDMKNIMRSEPDFLDYCLDLVEWVKSHQQETIEEKLDKEGDK